MLRNLFIIIMFQLAMHASANTYTDRSFVDKIYVNADKGDESVKTLFKVAKKVQQFLNVKLSKMPSDSPTVTLKIEGTPPSTDTFRIIYFKRHELKKMTSVEILHKIVSHLIRRTLVGLGAKNNISSPEWLTSALVYQFIIGETLSSAEKYPVTRLAIINKKYPNFDHLIEKEAPSAKHFWLYNIYAEQCAVFFRGITSLKNGKKNLLNYLIKRKTLYITDYFSQLYDDFQTPRKRNSWYKNTSHRVCFDVINPYPPEEIRKKVTSLLSITIARPGNNGFGTAKVPLEEVSEESYKTIDINFITILQRELMAILLTSSQTIRPAVGRFVANLNELKRGEHDGFKEKIIETKKEFQQAINRQIELNRYLDLLEKQFNDTQTEYKRIIMAAEIAEQRNIEKFEKLNEYLNSLEKKLAAIIIE